MRHRIDLYSVGDGCLVAHRVRCGDGRVKRVLARWNLGLGKGNAPSAALIDSSCVCVAFNRHFDRRANFTFTLDRHAIGVFFKVFNVIVADSAFGRRNSRRRQINHKARAIQYVFIAVFICDCDLGFKRAIAGEVVIREFSFPIAIFINGRCLGFVADDNLNRFARLAGASNDHGFVFGVCGDVFAAISFIHCGWRSSGATIAAATIAAVITSQTTDDPKTANNRCRGA